MAILGFLLILAGIVWIIGALYRMVTLTKQWEIEDEKNENPDAND